MTKQPLPLIVFSTKNDKIYGIFKGYRINGYLVCYYDQITKTYGLMPNYLVEVR